MLNAAISAVQGTEVAVSPAGVGVRLSVGEILDPVNDLVERFSWIMLLSTVSLGIQKVLLDMGVWFGFRVLMVLSMAVLLVGIWLPRAGGLGIRGLGLRLIVAAVVVRFCIPVVGVTSEALYDAFLSDTYTRSTRSLDVIRGKIRMPIVQPEDGAAENDAGLLERLRKRFQSTREVLGIQARLDALKETAEAGIDHITSLMIVFLSFRRSSFPSSSSGGSIGWPACFSGPGAERFPSCPGSDRRPLERAGRKPLEDRNPEG